MDWTPFRTKLQAEGSLTLRVKVIPKSARTVAIGEMADGSVKIRVAAVPEKGKANAELTAYLAEVFSLPRSSITLMTGATSPAKLFKLTKV
jgi:uncharacterized protein YggU (UPF0235/DUF167 family)